jgi:hypothetical protein
VQICNRALQKLGASTILSLTEDSTEGRACNLAYEPVRDALLRSHWWSFAIKRASLAASSTSPPFGYDNAFPLPADYLKLVPPDHREKVYMTDWKLEDVGGSRCIVTDEDAPLEIRYVSRVTDPNKFDSLFVEALSARLAMEMCEQLTQSNSKRQLAMQEYQDVIRDARKHNAFETPPVEAADGSWITDRL